jgi:hypothetical protein
MKSKFVHNNYDAIKLTNQTSQPLEANIGLRQRYGPSPVIFNIYMNKILKLWQQTTPKGKTISNGTV